MRFPDPALIKKQLAKERIIFAATQLQGSRESQEDYFINYNDECFAVADGVGSIPNGEVASKLAAETAIWGYKHIRMRPFYWADKQLLIKRIFRSSNLAVWQKRRESGFEAGLATTLSILIVSAQKIWAGSVGDTSILLYRDGLIDELTLRDVNELGTMTRAVGFQRLGLVPHIAVEKLLPRDVFLLATDGVINCIDEEELRATFDVVGETTQSITNAVVHLLTMAQSRGSTDNMTACLVKRLGNSE
ncbi:MAG TPA: PP2C family serine/threonine-protein phosphatase [Patescibacteria group bacterium]|jgi:serine/threonine protein phosphatase PrpC|nr:PP2C family serine/threonine-protein phosphatase [Patescibacteria group bacterium]